MIVVDTSVIHYCWVRGQHTDITQAVWRLAPKWHAPTNWRSDLCNVPTANLQRGSEVRCTSAK